MIAYLFPGQGSQHRGMGGCIPEGSYSCRASDTEAQTIYKAGRGKRRKYRVCSARSSAASSAGATLPDELLVRHRRGEGA
jgi:malonyl CoA-acyl carrier protein transacylase